MKKLLFFNFVLFSLFHSYVFGNSTNVHTSKNSNGDVVAVWQTFDGTNFNLGTSFLPASGTWSSSTTIGTASEMDTNPIVALNNAGKFVVVWSAVDYTLGLNRLYMVYYNGSTWSSVITLSSGTETVFSNYTVSFDDSDWLVVTWSSYSMSVFDNIVSSCWGDANSTLNGPSILG